MFKKILIANRGEIACRIIRTCRRLGVEAVAVYSDADAGALHVKLADAAIHVGPARAADSYLNVERVVAAARESGAEAIHPGYGFLSENADFARAVRKAGLVFIGPAPETIDAMGSKSAAKALMDDAGVPVVPGYHGEDQDARTLGKEAQRIGFPLMIKAAAGGGGKGMRIVPSDKDFADALEGARREAKGAFGDDRVLLERYVEHPRHIELQVFGDTHGAAVHVFERECSLQRRFQKVVEETPSPFITDTTRRAMGEAAVAAARAVDYVGAGTVEFIVGADQSFFFMEMNTRLQVEHPVTEETTGLDLVEWQLRVAAGEPLPLAQDDIRQAGHAIEARLYAENPARDFLPAPGRIAGLHWAAGEGVRIDTGVEAGDAIGSDYDPMVAKITVAGDDRGAAIRRLRAALAHTAVFGLTTNMALLRGIALHPDFAAGAFDTGFIEHELETLLAPPPCEAPHAAAVAAALLTDVDDDAAGPWRPDAFRVTPDAGWRFMLREESGEETLWRVRGSLPAFSLARDGEDPVPARASAAADGTWSVAAGGHALRLLVRRAGPHFEVADGERALALEWVPAFAPAARRGGDEAHPQSPMPGRIVAVHVGEGTAVEPGSALVTLEGMKMEYTVKAAVAGTVRTLFYAEGDMVDAEAMLVEIEPAEDADG